MNHGPRPWLSDNIRHYAESYLYTQPSHHNKREILSNTHLLTLNIELKKSYLQYDSLKCKSISAINLHASLVYANYHFVFILERINCVFLANVNPLLLCLHQVVHSRRESDAGTYWCEAHNELGTVRSRNATLQVASKYKYATDGYCLL